jgi:hypothetical protein
MDPKILFDFFASRTRIGFEVPNFPMILVVLATFCALSNVWGTRGKHFGWMLLVAVAVLAVAGY